MINEKTIGDRASCSGIGVHTGRSVTMTLVPAPAGYGIRFCRTDCPSGRSEIPALAENVSGILLATRLSNDTHTVGTVEHVLSALYCLGVDNVLIEIDGPEVPIMDGSAAAFCDLIRRVGLVEQDRQRRVLRVLETVEIRSGDKWARLSPRLGSSLELHAQIEFANEVIGVQEAFFSLEDDDFETDLAPARTFGFASEVDNLRQRGLAMGGSLDNAIIVDREGVMNPEGLRFHDEFVRHKILDAIGDLSLAGYRIAGRYEANQPGHQLNFDLVSALLASTSSWCVGPARTDDMRPLDDLIDIGAQATA